MPKLTQRNPFPYLLFMLGVFAIVYLISTGDRVAELLRGSRAQVATHTLKPETKARLRVIVLNGWGVPKAAARVREILWDEGIDVLDIGNTDTTARTLIIDHRAQDLSNAMKLKKILNQGLLAYEPETFMGVDVTIVLGKDFNFDKIRRSIH